MNRSGRIFAILLGLVVVVMGPVIGHAQPPSPSVAPIASAPPTASAPPSASAAPASSAPASVAVPPAVALLIKKTEHIRALEKGTLDVVVDPTTLFDVELEDDDAVAVEARRLAAVVERAKMDQRPAPSATPPSPPLAVPSASPSASSSSAAAPAPPTSVDYDALRRTNERLWRARVALDEARLSFYRLPATERRAILETHRKRQTDHQSKAKLEIVEADRDAAAAEKEKQKALEAAKAARTEAERAVHTEYARLLGVTKKQAEYSSKLAKELQEIRDKGDSALGARRQVTEAIAAQQKTRDESAMDTQYASLRKRLKLGRADLAVAIDALGNKESHVPTAGPDPLEDVPAEINRTKVDEEREQIRKEAIELVAREEELRFERAHLLMSEVEMLNKARLEMLPYLSANKRGDVTGFGPEGLDQARSELKQVWQTIRYELHATSTWVKDMRSGDGRTESAWTATLIALKWLVPIVIFIWWRRRAKRVLKGWRDSILESRRKKRGTSKAPSTAVRVISFVLRIRASLEWLLLLWSVVWLLPKAMSQQLEVELVTTVFSWTLGGTLVVNAIDALSSDEVTGPRRAPSALQTAHLRLRSLRVVGRAVVTVGLILSLSTKLVGQGTIYSWVFSTCWFAAIPILLFIVSWWRPVVFERLELIRKKGRLETWVLANRDGAKSPIAAIVGGVFMFVTGAYRVVRGWVVTFTITRRLLAYLFRRDMTKKASEGEKVRYKPLPKPVFDMLGPSTPSGDIVPSVADDQVKQIIERIRRPGGGLFAIVGERGAGKTTLVERIAKSSKEVVSFSCPTGGLLKFKRALNAAYNLGDNADPDEVASNLMHTAADDSAIVIDDAHHLIIPMMEGLTEFDEVLDLARSSSVNCTWVFAIDSVVWRFLERARGAKPLFDAVIHVAPWSEEGIVRLLTHRSESADVDPVFDLLMGALPEDADEIDKMEALQRTEESYYRLLWDYAAGNPGVALHFWRKSLGIAPDKTTHVRLFEAPDPEDLQGLPDSTVFVLRAIVQLGWANLEQICAVTALPAAQVKDALRYGSVKGYFLHDEDRYHITWAWFRAITRFLQRRHLLFSR